MKQLVFQAFLCKKEKSKITEMLGTHEYVISDLWGERRVGKGENA